LNNFHTADCGSLLTDIDTAANIDVINIGIPADNIITSIDDLICTQCYIYA